MAVAAALAACGDDGGAAPAGSAAGGDATYEARCATCHGSDGSGGHAPALGDGVAAEAYTVDEMVAIVAEGRDGMPAFADDLTDDQIAAVVAYVRDELRSAERGEVDVGGGPRGSLEGVPPELDPASAGDDWAAPNGDLTSHRARPDSPITSETVDQLEVQWTYEVEPSGGFGMFPTTPLVSGDTVYVGDLTTRVRAIDRATGEERFVVGEAAGIFGPTGVGIGYGQVYGTTAGPGGRGSVLVAYDAGTGEEAWRVDLGANGSDINMAPSVFGGLVFAATSGYGGGTRATIYAVDAETGSVVWDFPVIEDPDLWGNPELNSGGGVWHPPAIDAERGIAYFGTGNPYPFPGAPGFPNGSSRPGDNRWTDSMLALEIATGELVWGHQAVPHDIFDRDTTIAARVDVEIDGETRSVAISTGKVGVVFGLDADTGEPIWRTEVGVHQNDELTEIDGPTEVLPGSLGGVLTPIAIADGVVYLTVINAAAAYAGPEESSAGFSVMLGTRNSQAVAVDAATGEILWDVELDGDSFGGATVAGDLVFTSTFAGELVALDRATGEEVWSYQAPGGINGWPAVAGDQLIVPVGLGDAPQLVAFGLPDP
jgi:glucose dehydrogenase/cytochrome c5